MFSIIRRSLLFVILVSLAGYCSNVTVALNDESTVPFSLVDSDCQLFDDYTDGNVTIGRFECTNLSYFDPKDEPIPAVFNKP